MAAEADRPQTRRFVGGGGPQLSRRAALPTSPVDSASYLRRGHRVRKPYARCRGSRGRGYAEPVESLAKVLLGTALALALLGGGLLVAARVGIERLPGDLSFRRGNVTVYAPVGLMILLSVVLTIALNLFLRR